MNATELAEAYRRITTGDQDPPKPWAYLSGLGIANVDESVNGGSDVATFYFNVGRQLFSLTIDEQEA